MPAVVFDCDGVLVDSEDLADAAWEDTAARYGVDFDAATRAWSKGRTDRDLHARLAPQGLPAWDGFVDELHGAVATRYEAALRPFPDAVATVRALSFAGVRLAVASSSPRRRLDLALELSDLVRYFEVTVAGDEVARGKPAPDIYLAAAAGLGVDAPSCIAVEDSAAGAAAAAAAGMRVVAVLRPGAPPPPGYAAVSELEPELILTWLGLR